MEHHNTETRRLRTWVHLPGPSGEYVAFGPDDDLPQWAADQLADNPRVWRSDDDDPEEPGTAAPSLIGHRFEPGSMVSGPMTTMSALPPSSTPMARTATGSPGRTQQAPPGAEPGLAEARRRYGPPPDAA